MTELQLLSGVDALVQLLLLRQHLDEREGLTTGTMVSGYPGSPLGTLDLALEREQANLEAHRILHRPGVNEELAAATVWGSQMGATIPYAAGVDGVAGVWYGKAPGLDRSGDAMKHGNSMGAGPNGGVVMLCGDDPSAKSSTLTCDSQHTFEDACMPVLFPGDQQEIIDLGLHAFRMSRFAGPWVGLKVVTSVADGIGTVDLDASRHALSAPTDAVVGGRPWQHVPQRTIGPHQIPEQELLVVRHRLSAAVAYARHNRLDRAVGAEQARTGIVCAGKTYYDVLQAFADRGIGVHDLAAHGVRILKLAMTYPVVPESVLDLAAACDELVVIEEKRPFIETQVRSLLHERGLPNRVLGKRDAEGADLVSAVGELDPHAIGHVLGRVVADLPAVRGGSPLSLPLIDLPGRAPGYCSGCPHNRSTVAPDGALVGGGVGCHGIMYFEARQVATKKLPPTPMGAEGVPWIGLAPFVDEPHLIQNLGDGTLSHSGVLAIRASVAAHANVTFKILYNGAVAMTGGQEVAGLMDVPALTRALDAEGVQKVVVCAEDPSHYGKKARWAPGVEVLDRDHLDDVQDRLRAVRGVSVVIYDQRCAAESRRLRKRGQLETPPARVVINEAVCEGCGDCSAKSNCLSVLPLMTELGEKRQIHDPSCNRDYTCLEGDCPSFVTITPSARGRAPAPAKAATRPTLPDGTLPMPAVPAVDGQYGMYFSGIGGTGVVTANRIIATAAEAGGLFVSGLDQTGLSQKAGAVVSHLHVATTREALGSVAVGEHGAHLYLSGDILQAANAKHLATVIPGVTVAVVDSELTPTAAMLQTDTLLDISALKDRIVSAVGSERVALVDSKRIADVVFNNHLLANIVLLGAAFQLGGIPLSFEQIDAAMQRQGQAAADNRSAFAWGRWAVHAPSAVDERLASADVHTARNILDPSPAAGQAADRLVPARSLPADLVPLIRRRTAQVIDYQDDKLAARYLDLVEAAAKHDDASHGHRLTRAVADAWFRLLTYKDEYEVARLHLLADHDATARSLGIDGPYEVTYHLHPPTLRRLGLSKKLPMGKPYELSFKALRRMKKLRGTPFDVFGRDRDRRLERALIEEYEQLVRAHLDDPYDRAVAIAESALTIKGYGPVKDRTVAAWRAQVAELTAAAVPAP
ncbi:MAG TPA: indolepyruvate ferredoxin oxidoreductase family protein [Mycobacteriales bacterium]|nr:indolepyruvate ferredoxin oxidoreductase family protein [Mycobacteriales bacterium]